MPLAVRTNPGIIYPNTASISTVRGTDQTGVEGVWFEADTDLSPAAPAGTSIYNPKLMEPLYRWTFGDPGTFGRIINVLPQSLERNVAYGPKCFHVFGAPGSYTVTLSIYDRATRLKVAEASTTITVKDPATEWSGARTILYDPSGVGDSVNFPGANVQTTLAGCLSAYKALSQTGRLLLKRGEVGIEFLDSGGLGSLDNSFPNFHLGAWGSGAAPRVDMSAIAGGLTREAAMDGSKDITVWGLRWQGEYDDTTETGNARVPFQTSGTTQQGFNTFYQNDMDGFEAVNPGSPNGTSPTEAQENGVFLFLDCSLTNCRNYGLLGSTNNARWGLRGTRMTRSALALAGGDGPGGNTDGDGNDHTTLRLSGNSGDTRFDVYLGQMDMASFAGWPTSGGLPSEQAFLRISNSKVGQYIYADRITGEGYASLDSSAGSGNDNPVNCRFDKCIIIGTDGERNLFTRSYGGTVLDNCLLLHPEVEYSTGAAAWRGFHRYEDQNDSLEDNSAEPQWDQNCTYIDLYPWNGGTDANPFVEGDSPFPLTGHYNGLTHYPNLDIPQTPDTPFEAFVQLFTPRNVSWQWSGSPTPDYTYGTPTHMLAFDGQAGNFTDGLLITNGSGFSARIVKHSDDGTTGTLWLTDVTEGDLSDNDTISDTSSGTASANGDLVLTGVVSAWMPTAASAAYRSATNSGDAKIPVDDIRGYLRDPVHATRGAWDPDATPI